MSTNGNVSKGEKPTLNGNLPHSQTVNHVFSYPLIHELATTYQGTSVGALSINSYNTLYDTFVQPIKPYLQTPYEIFGPYIHQVDAFGDSSLETVDGYIPALKSTNFGTLQGYAHGAIVFPFKFAGESRDYVFSTYNDEYSKMPGENGLIKSGKSVISTELRMASDALHYVADFLGPKKDELQAKIDQLKQSGQASLDQLKQGGEQAQKSGAQKLDQAQKTGSQKLDQAQKTGSQKLDQAQKTGAQKVDQAKSQVQQ